MIVGFFGDPHAHVKSGHEPLLELIVEKLIAEGATRFLVGHEGNFDLLVVRTLAKIKRRHRDLYYSIVITSMPDDVDILKGDVGVCFDEVLTGDPKKMAERRNLLFVKMCDVIVSGVAAPCGPIYVHEQMAQEAGKRVIRLFDFTREA